MASRRIDCHVCFGSEGDLRVSEVWESREQLEAFQQGLMPVLTEAGINFEGAPEPEVHEVHGIEAREYSTVPALGRRGS